MIPIWEEIIAFVATNFRFELSYTGVKLVAIRRIELLKRDESEQPFERIIVNEQWLFNELKPLFKLTRPEDYKRLDNYCREFIEHYSEANYLEDL